MFGTARPKSMRLFRALTIGLLAATAACDQATGPASDKLDANAALADYRALQQMYSSEGFAGVTALAGRSPVSASTAIAAMRALPGLAGERTGRQYALDLFRAGAAQARGTSFGKTIISTRHLGRTLVYNPALDQYVIDPARTGAPANGVRFIVYEVDAKGKPVSTKEIGRADLLDEGANTGEAIALRLIVVTRGATTLDYKTRVDIGTTTGSIDVSGFAAEGNDRLDFTIGLDARKVGTTTLLDADFDLAVKPRGFSVLGTVRGVQEGKDGEGKISLIAKHQANTLKVDLNGQAGNVDGGITWNGKTFVTISGPAASPIVKGPTGLPLTAAEAEVVRSVVKMSDDVFKLVEDLVKPVQDLVLLGWIL